ncbi:MAG: AAA family ATPase [Bacteroidales bacterium]|nr:AAA family ATPase [Bacteroidales bacterium]
MKQEVVDMVIGMTYKSVSDLTKLDVSKGSNDREILLCSVFDDIYINGISIKDAQYTLLLSREHSKSHEGRLIVSYAPYISFNGIPNQVCVNRMQDAIGCKQEGCWFVYEISIRNQSELHFKAVVVNAEKPMVYSGTTTSKQRSDEWKSLIPDGSLYGISTTEINENILPYLTALRTKPFMLLAGISGTGKSRIVREMAKACWKEGDPEYGKNHPKNFCMVQVKPNWHDSSELIGYVSRLNGEKFVVGPFLRFLAAAIKDPDTPYFLCLDEMNLAPVEQYFTEYLSVIESRKLNDSDIIETDPIIEYEDTDAYGNLIDQLFNTPEERKAYKMAEGGKRLTIPQNFFVIGTVNMDETTFSFSRKVLDRAMTIEMNEVDLHGGLEKGTGNDIGYIGNSIIGDAAEGCDVYEDNKELCDQVLDYLEQVNAILEGTPFKIAYRTRNEFLMYAVNRKKLDEKTQLWQNLDEMTSMKILSRIEGDEERTKKVLNDLKNLVKEQIVDKFEENANETPMIHSISATKIDEMLAKLKNTGFTSYWT